MQRCAQTAAVHDDFVPSNQTGILAAVPELMQDCTAQDAVFLRRVESRDMHADIRAVRLCDLPDRVVICQYIHARHILIVG